MDRQAVKVATEKNYIRATRLDRGATVYSIKWQDQGLNGPISSKWNPVVETEVSVQKGTPDGFKKEPANSSKKSQNAFRKEPPYKEEKQFLNKQQTSTDESKSFKLLLAEGFAEPFARQIAQQVLPEVIANQIAWQKYRNPSKNKLGYLRKAMMENWEMPPELAQKQKRNAHWREQKEVMAQDEKESSKARQKRVNRSKKKLKLWGSLSLAEREKIKQMAISQEASQSIKNILERKCVANDRPPFQFLDQLSSKELD